MCASEHLDAAVSLVFHRREADQRVDMRNVILACVAVTLVALAVIMYRLYPPREMTIAAGPAGGAYHETARSYAAILARNGLRLNILETEGSVENAGLISRGDVDAAFLQGGIPVDRDRVEAIGSIFYEPIIFIIRAGADINPNPAKWQGLRINSGAEGSGTEAALRQFERVVGLSRADNTHLEIPYAEAIDALLAGELDIVVFVAPLDAPYVEETFGNTRLRHLIIDHPDAISRLLSFATLVTVPSGGLLLDPVTPKDDRTMIALEARLAVNADLHPALVDRLTMAAIELHGNRGVLAEVDQFPSVRGTGLLVNNTARLLIQEGPSTWHDWLPYWVAAQINRVFLLFLPFFFIVLPILRALPSTYAYAMRRRVWRHYPEIRRIEDELSRNPELVDVDAMQQKLSELEERLSLMLLPAAYRQVQYDARLHLQLVQLRIAALANKRAAAEPQD